MQTLLQQLESTFTKAVQRAFPAIDNETLTPIIEVIQTTNKKFGDYQFNSAMRLAKIVKEAPRTIATTIVEHVETGGMIEKLEIAGPGFINITLSPTFLNTQLNTILDDPSLGIEKPKSPQKIIVEFSSPNTAKELHVGHLRSTIIGDSIARTFEFLGHHVLRLNHVGDWGTAFGMLIAFLKQFHPEILNGEENTDLTHLVAWYKESKKLFDEDADFKKTSQLEVVNLQGGDPDSLLAWETICTISRNAYNAIYDLLDVKIIERGESFYNPQLPAMIEELTERGLITVSGGAKCLFPEGFTNREGDPMPFMLQKSDGGYGYDTTDLAAMRQRTEKEQAERIIVITDAGQSLHFQLLEKAAQDVGYLDPKKTRFDHVTFGLVLGNDGKKFRTRSGETEALSDLIHNAIDKARAILEERNPDMDPKEKEETAKRLGIGAIKYADLSCHRTGDYTFSYDRMLRFEGNTAAFLMYSYVRIVSIQRKIGIDSDTLRAEERIQLEHPSEYALALHLLRFGEALEQVTTELLPHRLSDYLYSLANTFNAFYRDCKVEGVPEQNSRLLLSELTAKILKQGLHLLGVEVVERM